MKFQSVLYGCWNELVALFLLLIGLLTNFPLRYIHSILYAIATSVTTGLNLPSSFFLARMNEAIFTKSLARWKSFIEAVNLEVCSHMHVDSVFLLSENLGRIRRIAKMTLSCPPELDKASSRCAQDFDTFFVF